MKKINMLVLTGLMLLTHSLFAQNAEMADTMRSEGKIYVVIAITLVIFFGLIGFLVYTDRKVAAMEKRINELK
ncbi:hypothetical protein WSM22_12290 [Cytophagales bacterium WSM2-2]|nr:hypothetical protein WSM22_12290 [Cytophagales bacterium WSM2-2]